MPSSGSVVYLDNAATSHPKPEAVYRAADGALRAGGNPGRGGHRVALAAGRRVLAAREAVAALFGVKDAARVLFTSSATDSLNLALKGLLHPGDHCITTVAEHNALRRPLVALALRGVEVTWLPVSPEGIVDPGGVRAALRPNTRLIALAHGSNVTGALQPVAELGEIARRAGVFLLVDAAQTAGSHPIDVEAMGIHLLAAPGHKGLLGPQGTGILYVAPDVPLRPVREGGTGSMATLAEQPDVFPEGFESGTLNVPGIAGVGAGADFLLSVGVEAVHARVGALTAALVEGLRRLPGVTVHGPADPARRCGVVSLSVDGLDPGALEEQLDSAFGVVGRAGLHCAPGAHEVLGTLPLGGTMRLSPGYFNTEEDIEAAVKAVAAVAALARR
ncbi:aminotransferase class V-fold PLP-dependent enzyme [Caldinitratiruptor microaerophilus]|uniref:cysteine desulfurase n=1 Tax=Caldinitratiruptor microaerophilus TaxID=671077 RepID=A0AA35CMH6_9FIRM|nr:aminotransferase class V-fold PLP-dependent enzyme [Caldinitratiruptor microaerophilus]BDG60071.1 cysteine desulfurase [Caldinitratiruptor microaerophilus]